MSDETTNLALPYILPSQAQKHVTHNEALQRLDIVTQLVVTTTLSNPPSDPQEGACYAVDTAATGLWMGKSGKLAFWQDGLWIFVQPKEGWRAWFRADDALHVHDGFVWTIFDPIGTPAFFGINTTADTTNRLTVSAQASLFNHAGNGHQIKVNKAAPADTASLLFQSGFSGRAEMGLAGSDGFDIKVSANGATWASALSITASGVVRMPQRPLVRATLGGGLATPATGSQTGFNSMTVNQGGFTLGATVPSGTGSRLVVPVAGPYLIAIRVEANPAGSFTVAAKVNGTTVLASIGDNDTTTHAYNSTAMGLALLQQGDWISLEHTGATPIDFAAGKTEVSLVML